MKKLFKPEDFDDYSIRESAVDLANMCNKKLNKIIESMPIVYGCENPKEFTYTDWNTGEKREDHLYTARLAFIEEIKKEPCKHSPKNYHPYSMNFGIKPDNRCKHCGVELEAIFKEKK